ncbi:MAG: hypothetical protein GX539_15055 [Candidatus Cloacimonetes bacterium]|nr:hypothetical protein [Candidatus Cloacimonadota bacterium]
MDRHFHALDSARRPRTLEMHELLRLLERKPPVKRAVDDAEHHDAEADAERECQDGKQRGTRTLPQDAETDVEVVHVLVPARGGWGDGLEEMYGEEGVAVSFLISGWRAG